jgi:mitochondrial import receptor subunit TOM20
VSISPDELRAALAKIKAEKLPDTIEEKEQYFMSQVGLGEQLCVQGAFIT